jgi:hypothetical protein
MSANIRTYNSISDDQNVASKLRDSASIRKVFWKQKSRNQLFIPSDRALKHVRMNGIERPFHRHQIISWVVHVVLMLSFIFLIGNYVDIYTSFAFCLGWVLVLLLGIHATFSNTQDEFLQGRFIEKDAFTSERIELLKDTILVEDEDWCEFCLWVVHKDSFHCQSCNKCTRKMDHHCNVFNNCIGQKNYASFFTCLFLANCVIILHFILQIIVLKEADDGKFDVPYSNAVFTCAHVLMVIFLLVPEVYLLSLCAQFTILLLKKTTYLDEHHLKPCNISRKHSRVDRTLKSPSTKLDIIESMDEDSLQKPFESSSTSSLLSSKQEHDIVPSCTDAIMKPRRISSAAPFEGIEMSL